MRLASPFLAPVHDLERDTRLDALARRLDPVAARLGEGRSGPALRGERLGHALHPLLTDLPLGCWFSAGVLDLVGGARSRAAAQRLVGVGLAMVPMTAAAGMADYAEVKGRGASRVGAVHAVGNLVVSGLYLMSWRRRRHGHHALGVAAGLLGGLLAVGTGYLGGHLSFARSVGAGERGAEVRPGSATAPSATDLPGAHDAADVLAAVEAQPGAAVVAGVPEPGEGLP